MSFWIHVSHPGYTYHYGYTYVVLDTLMTSWIYTYFNLNLSALFLYSSHVVSPKFCLNITNSFCVNHLIFLHDIFCFFRRNAWQWIFVLIGWQISYIYTWTPHVLEGRGRSHGINKERKIGPIGGEKKEGERGRGSVRILKESGWKYTDRQIITR
jgi:hypothetical protein